MDKKHVSCMNMHSNRSVKLLIEKFEGLGERKVQMPGKRQDWHIQEVRGRVAETVAKFEHSSFLGHRLLDARFQHNCNDQATERWLAELKRRMLSQVAQPSHLKLLNVKHSKLAARENEPDLMGHELLDEHAVLPPLSVTMDGAKSKLFLAMQCSDTSAFASNMELPPIPSFNSFDFCKYLHSLTTGP